MRSHSPKNSVFYWPTIIHQMSFISIFFCRIFFLFLTSQHSNARMQNNCKLAFSGCFVEVSFSSMVIRRSFISLLHFICLFSVANVILLLLIFDPRNIISNLPGFATIVLTLNQFKTICVSLDNLWAATL